MNHVSNSARKALIIMGKALPFFLCAIVLATYVETLFASVLGRYLCYGGVVIPNTPLYFVVGRLFEYDALIVAITLVVSIAINVCRWNLYAIMYLSLNLFEKSLFRIELEQNMIYIIVIANILASAYFVYKGITIYITKNKQKQ